MIFAGEKGRMESSECNALRERNRQIITHDVARQISSAADFNEHVNVDSVLEVDCVRQR